MVTQHAKCQDERLYLPLHAVSPHRRTEGEVHCADQGSRTVEEWHSGFAERISCGRREQGFIAKPYGHQIAPTSSVDLSDVYPILSPCKLGRLCILLVMKTHFPIPLGNNKPKKKKETESSKLLIIHKCGMRCGKEIQNSPANPVEFIRWYVKIG